MMQLSIAGPGPSLSPSGGTVAVPDPFADSLMEVIGQKENRRSIGPPACGNCDSEPDIDSNLAPIYLN